MADHRSARAEAKAAKAHAKAMRPFYAKKRYWALGVIAVIIIASIAGNSGKKNSQPTAHKSDSKTASSTSNNPLDHSTDVKIVACEVDATTGFMDAKLAVTNPSSKPSDYAITVAFESLDGKTQLDSALTSAQSVNPGQTATVTAQTLTAGTPGKFKCDVKEAIRTAS